MKKSKNILLFLLFLVIFSVHGQEFNLLRQHDIIPALDTLTDTSTYQELKKTNITEQTTLSWGGSWRFQAESFTNEQYQREGRQDNIWYLNRFLLHSHLNINNRFELFAEIGSSLITGKNIKSPVDKDILYVNQLFVSYEIIQELNVSLGRENLRLGSGRLVDIREGPNVRRSFDFIEFNYHTNNFKAKAFFTIPVRPEPEVFDNEYLKFDETFSGIYSTINMSGINSLDAYILYQKENSAIYNSGEKNERRASIGVRHFGKYKKLTYNNEMVYQFGKFGNQVISAWTLSINIERETNLFGEKINLGIKTEAISGDRNATDNKMNTFDALYPRGAYFGRVARFGPSNLIDVHPYINAEFDKWQVAFDYAAFWRYSLRDGVYGAALTLDYPDVNNKRFIAHQIGVITGYELNNFVNIELESNVIFPGAFLKDSNLHATLYHFVLTSEIKF